MRKQAATGLLNDLRSACFLILLATMFAPLVGLKAAGQNAAPDENAARAAKENELVKALNEKLMAASAASKAGDFDTAIKTLNQAAQLDSTRDLIWFKLGDAHVAAGKRADGAERTEHLTAAIAAYQKAIDIKKAMMAKSTTEKDGPLLAAYYNNLGEAYGRARNTEGAKNAYAQAVQLDPAHAGLYYFNLGAILVNADAAGSAAMGAFKMVPKDSPQYDKAQEQIEIIQQSPAFKSIKPYIQSPAFKAAMSAYIQSARNKFKDLQEKELGSAYGLTAWESTRTAPGAQSCGIKTGDHQPQLSCTFAESHSKDDLRAEYRDLVSAVRASLPSDWKSSEFNPEPDDGPSSTFSGPKIEVSVMITHSSSAYVLGLAVVAY